MFYHMAKDIREYFKRNTEILSRLPPDISQSTIDAVQVELSKVRSCDETDSNSAGGCSKRSPYIKLSPKDRATIGQYATQNGIAAAIRHFCQSGKFPDLKEPSAIRHFCQSGKFPDLKEPSCDTSFLSKWKIS